MVTLPLEPFWMIDLSSVSPPDENTYSFISFGGSAAIAAVVPITPAAIAKAPRLFAKPTGMSSSL